MTASLLKEANEKLSSLLILLIPLSFVLGYLFKGWMPSLKWTAPHMLFTIMFSSTWGLCWRDFLRVTQYKCFFALGLLGQLFMLPLAAFFLATLFFGVNDPYGVGLLCVAASPAAISTIIWSSITGGDVALGVLLVGSHVLIIPFAAPLMLKLFVGKSVHVPMAALFGKLMWSVFIPTVLSVIIYEKSGADHVKPALSLWSKLGMLYMIVLNTSVAFSSVPFDFSVLRVFVVVGLQVAVSYLLGFILGWVTGASRGVRITFSYFMGMKNNGAALVMALSGFSFQATLPVALTIMWQQPVASVFDRIWKSTSKGRS